MTKITELKTQLHGDVDTTPETLEKYSEDTSIFHIKPTAVVSPKNVDDLKKLLALANESDGKISLTARAAGTDMSGGPLTSSIVVDFLKYFNQIKFVDAEKAVAEPGVFYRDFDKETLKHGVILPSYTSSRELNTVGGMVANNSAGEKSLTYGKTDRYVAGLKVVLSDGNEYEFKKLSRAEWEEKCTLAGFEGDLYRGLNRLLLDNQELLKREKPIVSKNSAGYAVWDIYNEAEDSFDLTKLFTGSQGTLGLITEVTFSLIKPKNNTRMMVMFLRAKHLERLGEIINEVLAEKPESFESYDDKTFNVMLRVLPQLIKRLGGNVFKIAKDFLPEIKMIVTGGIPKLVLMAEFAADTDEEAFLQADRAAKALKHKFGITTRVTKSQEEGEKFWLIRRESFNLLRENVRGKHTAPFIDDLSVAPQYLPAFIPELYAILNEYDLVYTVAGHVGDGNFHIIPLMDFSRPDFVEIIDELSKRVYTLVTEYRGSITGEHNDGLIRTPYLSLMFSKEMLNIFTEIKDIFDPKRIFNPHKKVDPDRELLIKSIKRVTPK